MSFCSMMTWLDSFCSNGLFYILLLCFWNFLASVSRSMYLGLQEPGDQQLPKQDEPMEAVPCSPRGNGEEWGHCFLLHLSSWGFMSFCSMLTWLDAFCSNGLFYILLLFFCISWPPSLGLCILVSKEPGERQLPKQDEPMEAVPCSPGGMGRSGVTASYFIHLHEASCHFVVCWLGWIHFVAMLSLIIFCMSWLPSRSILFSKEPGDQQLPKQDEPMDKSPVKAVPCSPGGTGRSFSHPFWWGLSDQSQN
jgi:hypothetical protein